MALVIAHRGAHDPAPENSLEAFERAIALGVDLIELDVRSSADGEVVVHHDPDVARVPVAALPAAELRARTGAPTLAEALTVTAGRVGLDIEVKEIGCVERVVSLLSRVAVEPCVLTSFLPEAVAEARRLVPGLRTGLLVAGPGRCAKSVLDLARSLRVDDLAVAQELADAELLDRVAAHGLGCLVWTVNDPAAIDRYLADPAVRGVITDRPELALTRRAVIWGRTGTGARG